MSANNEANESQLRGEIASKERSIDVANNDLASINAKIDILVQNKKQLSDLKCNYRSEMQYKFYTTFNFDENSGPDFPNVWAGNFKNLFEINDLEGFKVNKVQFFNAIDVLIEDIDNQIIRLRNEKRDKQGFIANLRDSIYNLGEELDKLMR